MGERAFLVHAPTIGSVGPETVSDRQPDCMWCGRSFYRFRQLHFIQHKVAGHTVCRVTHHLLLAEPLVQQIRDAGYPLEVLPVKQQLAPGIRTSAPGVRLWLVTTHSLVPNRAARFCPTCFAGESNESSEVNLLSSVRSRQKGASVAVLPTDVPPDPVFLVGHDRIAVSSALAGLLAQQPEIEVEAIPFAEAVSEPGAPGAVPDAELASASSVTPVPLAAAMVTVEPVPAVPVDSDDVDELEPVDDVDATGAAGAASEPTPIGDASAAFSYSYESDDEASLPPDIAPLPNPAGQASGEHSEDPDDSEHT